MRGSDSDESEIRETLNHQDIDPRLSINDFRTVKNSYEGLEYNQRPLST